MTNQKNTPEKVAEVLEGSGLFKLQEFAKCDTCGHTVNGLLIGNECYLADPCNGVYRKQYDLISADQSEEILGKMGLQVDKDQSFWWLPFQSYEMRGFKPVLIANFDDIPKGHRTHANNAGLAYCCENMFDELKLVMEKEK